MSRHACKCSKQSSTVGGDMHRVGLQTTRQRNKLRCLFTLLCTSDPRCTVIEQIDAQWRPLYCRAWGLLNFRDANNVPCSVCSFFRHSGRGSCVQVLPHLIRTTQEPCPRPPFQGNLGIEGVEPPVFTRIRWIGLWVQPSPGLVPRGKHPKTQFQTLFVACHSSTNFHFSFKVFLS